MVTGIIFDSRPGTPIMPFWRSCTNAPTVSVVLTILNAFSGEASVASTAAFVIGRSTSPNSDSGSGLDRFRLFAIARGANAHHRNDARRGELRRVALQGLVRKTVEHKGSIDGLQVVA